MSVITNQVQSPQSKHGFGITLPSQPYSNPSSQSGMFTRLLQILLGHDLGFKITYSFGFSFQFLFILFFIKLIVFSLPLPSVSSHSLTSLTCCFSSHFLMLLFLYFFLKLRPLCPNLPFSPCTSSSARSVIDHHASSIDVNIFFSLIFLLTKTKSILAEPNPFGLTQDGPVLELNYFLIQVD